MAGQKMSAVILTTPAIGRSDGFFDEGQAAPSQRFGDVLEEKRIRPANAGAAANLSAIRPDAFEGDAHALLSGSAKPLSKTRGQCMSLIGP